MSTCPIIAIDPGNTQSGYCVIDRSTLRPLEFGKIDNAELLQKLSSAGAQGWRWAVIEMVASYGMSVGREVFDTVLWIGRFYQALNACCPVRVQSESSRYTWVGSSGFFIFVVMGRTVTVLEWWFPVSLLTISTGRIPLCSDVP